MPLGEQLQPFTVRLDRLGHHRLCGGRPSGIIAPDLQLHSRLFG
jgi:hypothetical protein